MKLPFSRKKTDASIPKEVQDYYQAEKRERVGVASLLAIGTLIVTILVALGIFYGGRWVWRHPLGHDKKKGNTVATVKAPDDDKSSSTTKQPEASKNTDSSAAGSSAENAGNSGQSAASAPSTTAATSNGSLPNTGPANNLSILVTVTVLSIVLAELYQRRRARS